MSTEVSGILVAAHELKAPLAVLRQLALTLEAQLSPTKAQLSPTKAQLSPTAPQPSPPATAYLCRQMVSVSDRALRQVNDLAKIARLEDGLFAPEPVSVRGLCDQVLAELAPLYQGHDRALAATYRNKSRLAFANRDLLHSILYNFCVNALHYSESHTTSQLSASEHRGRLRLSVRDYGPALPAAVWRRLQTGFLDQPTPVAMRPGSTGLGLYIASQFARHMHAQLGAIRHRDGTSFYIELPISKQASLF